MEQKNYYTDEKNSQIVIALLKAHAIRRIIVSPGSANAAFAMSAAVDPFFTLFSAVDERHAGYMAVGMSAEAGEPVVVSCTGSSASRNLYPALTEAYYRKIPVLAITSTQERAHFGNLFPQMSDRTSPPPDAVRRSFQCPLVKDECDFAACELSVNRAVAELHRQGGGPVHINLETRCSLDFSVCELPAVRKIEHYDVHVADWPDIPRTAKIAVFIGAHKNFNVREQRALEDFVKLHNVAVFCDPTSSYDGHGRVFPSFLSWNSIKGNPEYESLRPDLIIHIGEVSNSHAQDYFRQAAPVWRVSPDGELRDRFGMLEKVFEEAEDLFFEHYGTDVGAASDAYRLAWAEADQRARENFPEFPYSNLWIAAQTVPRIPRGSVLHIGMSNVIRSWSDFIGMDDIRTMGNVGCCGIDGCVSTLIGASLVNVDKLYFCVVGDLSFFYDLNSLGNRHVGKNLRILLINNGCGGVFHNRWNNGAVFGENVDDYVAAGGHFGSRSKDLVRHYATDLGFKYLSSINKGQFNAVLDEFVNQASDRPIVLECFTDPDEDCRAMAMRDTVISRIQDSVAKSILVSEMKRFVPGRIRTVVKRVLKIT